VLVAVTRGTRLRQDADFRRFHTTFTLRDLQPWALPYGLRGLDPGLTGHSRAPEPEDEHVKKIRVPVRTQTHHASRVRDGWCKRAAATRARPPAAFSVAYEYAQGKIQRAIQPIDASYDVQLDESAVRNGPFLQWPPTCSRWKKDEAAGGICVSRRMQSAPPGARQECR